MDGQTVPHLLHTVLDAEDVRELAEFYRRLLGLQYRPGDEPPSGEHDDADWLVLTDRGVNRVLAFQRVSHLPRGPGRTARYPSSSTST